MSRPASIPVPLADTLESIIGLFRKKKRDIARVSASKWVVSVDKAGLDDEGRDWIVKQLVDEALVLGYPELLLVAKVVEFTELETESVGDARIEELRRDAASTLSLGAEIFSAWGVVGEFDFAAYQARQGVVQEPSRVPSQSAGPPPGVAKSVGPSRTPSQVGSPSVARGANAADPEEDDEGASEDGDGEPDDVEQAPVASSRGASMDVDVATQPGGSARAKKSKQPSEESLERQARAASPSAGPLHEPKCKACQKGSGHGCGVDRYSSNRAPKSSTTVIDVDEVPEETLIVQAPPAGTKRRRVEGPEAEVKTGAVAKPVRQDVAISGAGPTRTFAGREIMKDVLMPGVPRPSAQALVVDTRRRTSAELAERPVIGRTPLGIDREAAGLDSPTYESLSREEKEARWAVRDGVDLYNEGVSRICLNVPALCAGKAMRVAEEVGMVVGSSKDKGKGKAKSG
ncbi:hypothetical protein SCHPADRAFT_896587 [Schizopora paradoxa]|uniref:Uncharacterized protein n=1 Tax=Schizopora paradoxa TaxID=27342 RepID=A0A0H2R166_9AGAM|nr:hypothetical protein SCHPADRAFT_896587 [Schizopora paradoxa]